jgi:hypothetical protein
VLIYSHQINSPDTTSARIAKQKKTTKLSAVPEFPPKRFLYLKSQQTANHPVGAQKGPLWNAKTKTKEPKG